MEINIFRHEFRANLRSVAVWSASVAALLLIFLSLFKSFAAQADQINQLMANYPKALLDAFGLSGADMASVLGFFSFIFVFIQVCMAIQAAGYGFSLVSVEEREWTADFLLSKPVKRTSVLTAKLLGALVCLLITEAVVWAAAFGFVNVFRAGHPYDAGTLALLLATLAPFQLFFFAVGLAVSLLVKRIKNVMPYSLGLVFGMYVLSVFNDVLGTSALETVTPFKHFEARYIVENGALSPLALVSGGVIVAAIAAGYALYSRRDIPSVS